MSLRLGLALSIALAPGFAQGACPIELAVYGEAQSSAEINFVPNSGHALVTNAFRMLLDNDLVLDGIVMWTEEPSRPAGMLMHKCPDGDVTGAEIEKCTVWQGIIYTSDKTGNIGLLPGQGNPAPETLIFADLGPALRYSAAYGTGGFSKTPFDIFALKGCQE